jgi:hypothetical protein
LPKALGKGLTATINWIQEYADVADNINLNYRGKEVLKALTSAGFKTNEFAGDKFVKGDKEVMGRYILGQVIDNLQSGMPPHPMVSHLAKHYLAMPDVKKADTNHSVKPPPP